MTSRRPRIAIVGTIFVGLLALYSASVLATCLAPIKVVEALDSQNASEHFRPPKAGHGGQLQSPAPQPRTDDDAEEGDDQSQHVAHGNAFCMWFRTFWAGLVVDPVAIFTALLFIATLGLWLATLSLLREARKSSERQLRAYVHPVGVRASAMGSTSNVAVIFRNGGKTPARHVTIQLNRIGRVGDLPNDFNFPDANVDEFYTSVPPGEQTASIELGIQHVDLQRAISGTIWLFLYGWIEYNDVFGDQDRHRTEFCYRLTMSAIPTGVGPIPYSHHSRHNAADADCIFPSKTRAPRKRRGSR